MADNSGPDPALTPSGAKPVSRLGASRFDPGQLLALADKLDFIWKDDHERGCQGHCYECSCGFDTESWERAQDVAVALRNLATQSTEETKP
jgi:hypothetical protein